LLCFGCAVTESDWLALQLTDHQVYVIYSLCSVLVSGLQVPLNVKLD